MLMQFGDINKNEKKQYSNLCVNGFNRANSSKKTKH